MPPHPPKRFLANTWTLCLLESLYNIYCLSFTGLGASQFRGPWIAFPRLARQRRPHPETRLPAVQPRTNIRGVHSRKPPAFSGGQHNRSSARGAAECLHLVFRSMGELLGKRVGIQTLGMSFRREQSRFDGCSNQLSNCVEASYGKMVGYGLDDKGIAYSFRYCCIQISSKVYPASHIATTDCSLHDSRAAGKCSVPSSAEINNGWNFNSTPPYVFVV